MINPISTGVAFISGLDSSSSILPICIKDNIDIVGRTTMAYTQTDKRSRVHEARERFIEEAGTGILWLFSIPLLRKGLANPIFKAFNPDSKNLIMKNDIDLRKITEDGYQSIKYKLAEECLNPKSNLSGTTTEKLNKIIKNLKRKDVNNVKDLNKLLISKFKGAHIALTGVSTLVPFFLLAYVLPKINQGLTKKLVKKEKDLEKKQNSLPLNNANSFQGNINKDNNSVFSKFTGNTDNSTGNNKTVPSFKRALPNILNEFMPTSLAQGAQVDPSGNMLVLDYGISGNRLRVARNKQERIETAIKEGGIIFFMYFGAKLLKKGLQAGCEKSGKLIYLDYITLKSNRFADSFKNALTSGNEKIKVRFYKISSNHSKIKDIDEMKKNKASEKIIKEAKSKNERSIIDFIDKAIKTDYKDGHFHKYATLEAANDLGLLGKKKGWLLNKKNLEVDKVFNKIKHNNKSIKDGKEFIDTEQIIKLSKDMKKILEHSANKIKDKPNPQKLIENIIKSNQKYKLAMILSNILICNLALGYGLPKLQYFIREKVWGSKEFPGIKNTQ